jgi:ABC-type dipeptide/oligopeptide/nickel transport system permease component
MARFIVRRVLIAIPLLFLASILTFLLVVNIGEPKPLEDLRARPGTSPAAIEQLEQQYHLNEPLVTRYVNWITDFVTGDFGTDVRNQEVKPNLWRSMQVTLRLLVFAQVCAVALGLTVGVIAAVRQYSAFDYTMTALAFFFFSIPTFVLASFLKEFGAIRFNQWARAPSLSTLIVIGLVVFGALAGWGAGRRRTRLDPSLEGKKLPMFIGMAVGAAGVLIAIGVFKIVWDGNTYRQGNARPLVPTVGQASARLPAEWWPRMQDYFWHTILPSLTLILIGFAGYSRYTRASMLDTLNSDYVRTARAKGLRERRVIGRHAFRNALIPVTTAIAIDFGALLAGAIITETVFGWDGMGQFFTEGLENRDPNVLLAFVMVTAMSVIFFNLIADIAYAWLDPRIRLG